MTLEEFVSYIKSDRWKSTVEMYQRLMAEGDKSKAKELKNKLPGMVVAGYCEGSHALENRRTWSGNAMFDVDHTQGRALEFLQKLKTVSWIKAGWRSVSYDGLKVVVRIEAETPEDYVSAYAVVAWHISRIIDFACDMSCKNPTRPCYASYDEEAFCKPDAELFLWRKFIKEHPGETAQIQEKLKLKYGTPAVASGPTASGLAASETPASGPTAFGLEASETPASGPTAFGLEASGTPVSGPTAFGLEASGTPASATIASGLEAPGTAASKLPAPAAGILRTFFNDFLSHNAFIPGAKNDFLLKLGRTARYKGLSDSELKQLEALAVERLSDAECPPEDIIPKVDAGYCYADRTKLADYQSNTPLF